MMSKIYKVDAATAEHAWIDADGYEEMYRLSIEENEKF